MLTSHELALRLVNCLPAATYELEAFCRLVAIEVTNAIPSAAVSCEADPRLQMNPAFIAQYCRRDEHLFLLTLHELWHILLGHTRLYPQADLIDNIAFDAIINAGLMRTFRGPAYKGFFEAIYAPDEFPGCLLRPPKSAERSIYHYANGPLYAETNQRIDDLIHRLYFGSRYEIPTYDEIREVLRKVHLPDTIFLLGGHDAAQGDLTKDVILQGALGQATAHWPSPPEGLAHGDGSGLDDWTKAIRSPGAAARAVFAAVLRRVLVASQVGQNIRQREVISFIGGAGVLPNSRDRIHPARVSLGTGALLWAQPQQLPVKVMRPKAAHVYLDVSGSMEHALPYLLGLLVPHARGGVLKVFQFSTEVCPLSSQDLRVGSLRSTGGTRINPVLEHILAAEIRHALILTDGYVERPRSDLAETLRARAVRLHVVLPQHAHRHRLQPLAHTLTHLPEVRA